MKNLITLLIVLFSLNSYSQTPIDYDNFDTDLASKILGQKFIEFRDTITQFGHGASIFVDRYPYLKDNRDLLVPQWSEYLYENLSKYNCWKMMENKSHQAGHIDREKWFDSEQTRSDLGKILYEGTPIPESEWSVYTSSMSYGENSCSLRSKFKTYEELALHIINGYENSIMHRCAQRGIIHNSVAYKYYDIKVYGLFSCCVMYDKETHVTKSVLNMVN